MHSAHRAHASQSRAREVEEAGLGPGGTRVVWTLMVGCVALLVMLIPVSAEARDDGIPAFGCGGCHGGGDTPDVELTADPSMVLPGDTVTLTLSISTANGPFGGFFLDSGGRGSFDTIDGEQTRLIGDGVSHSEAKRSDGGPVTFLVEWTAPDDPGGVVFEAFALSANGDDGSRGDGEGYATLSFAFGCSGETFYADHDQDGYGAEFARPVIDCGEPENHSRQAGDCDDNSPDIHPGGTEVCNRRDDDCDETTDEGVDVITLCEDPDGDGHARRGENTIEGCGERGYGLCDGDCLEGDPEVHPGKEEVCNLVDDDCDNRVDERARPTCGVGWCRRAASNCEEPIRCEPGEPQAEICNAFDEDCDGVNDNGTNEEVCGDAQMACVRGECVPAERAPDAGQTASDSGAFAADASSRTPKRSEDSGCAVGGTAAPMGFVVPAIGVFVVAWRRRRRAARRRCLP